MEIFQLFGVDWKLMLAQVINFAIVVFVLWRFAIKPVMASMEKRNAEIAKGLQDAEKAAKKLSDSDKEAQAKINESREQALAIITQAKKEAEAERHQAMEKSKQEVKVLIERAKEQIARQKDDMVLEARQELAATVSEALKLVIDSKFDKEMDRKYIDKMLKKV